MAASVVCDGARTCHRTTARARAGGRTGRAAACQRAEGGRNHHANQYLLAHVFLHRTVPTGRQARAQPGTPFIPILDRKRQLPYQRGICLKMRHMCASIYLCGFSYARESHVRTAFDVENSATARWHARQGGRDAKFPFCGRGISLAFGYDTAPLLPMTHAHSMTSFRFLRGAAWLAIAAAVAWVARPALTTAWYATRLATMQRRRRCRCR